jgi:nucleotide-binding universal stress UspA family protein
MTPSFTHVIVGIDAQDAHRDAITLAQDLVAPGGRLTLVHIHDGLPLFGKSSHAGAASEAAEHLRAEQLLASARTESGITSSVTIGASSVGRGLHHIAERRSADLLVIASTGRGLTGHVLMSDHTREAINGAPCPVAIAPAGYGDHMGGFGEIGVAYNGTPESEHALAVARELALEHQATVSVFEAIGLPTHLPQEIEVPYSLIANAWLIEAQNRLGRLEDVETHVVIGDPAEELTLYSASLDLLVVGSRDFGPLGRLMHSSTSRRLARTTRCPLLLLTRPGHLAILPSRAPEPADALSGRSLSGVGEAGVGEHHR